MPIKRPPNATWLRQYIGIPFVAGGRTLQGADCWGLLALVMNAEVGAKLPMLDTTAVIERGDAKAVGDLIHARIDGKNTEGWHEIPLEEAQSFDALLLRFFGQPIHVSLVIEPGWMLHTEQGIDSTYEWYLGDVWMKQKRIVSCWRHESRM